LALNVPEKFFEAKKAFNPIRNNQLINAPRDTPAHIDTPFCLAHSSPIIIIS